MKDLLEKHPGELMVLAFIAMGLSFVLTVVVGEWLGPIAGQPFGGLIDGADWQTGQFPAP